MKKGNRRQLAKYEGRKDRRETYSLSTEVRREYNTYIEKEPSLGDYVDILLRRKWVLIYSVAILVAVVAVGSLLMSPIFKAEATVEIAPEHPKVTTFQEVIELEAQQEEFYTTQYKLIKSKSLAKDVVNALQLDSHPEFAVKEGMLGFMSFMRYVVPRMPLINKGSDPGAAEEEELVRQEELINSFLDRVKISPDTESRLFQVSFESRDPKLAAKAVNTLVDKYIAWVLDRKLNTTTAAREFLEKQLEQVKAKLQEAEEGLSDFAKSVNIVSLDKDLNLTYKQLAELNDALSKAETARLSKEALYKEIQDGNYASLPQVINNPSIQVLNEEYTRLKSQYDNMAVIYKPAYPGLKRLAAQIKRIQSGVKGYTNRIAESVGKDYQTALRKENILRQRTEEQNKLIAELNDKTVQYRILEREVDTNKSIYENLLQRLKETEVTSGIKATNIQVVDYATAPLTPYKPNMKLNMLFATLVGLMAGVILAFVLEHFDNTIKDEEEVKRYFSFPFLGAIPLVEDCKEGLEKEVYMNPRSIISEAFRVIRTSIIYLYPGRRTLRSILVTSAQALEGKTTSASNLALSMVQSGLTVVLVDADFRKPRLHNLFLNNGNELGLSTYLNGGKRFSGVIKRTEIDGLDIIPSGPLPPDPAELLSSKKMKMLLGHLLKKYDRVVLDGAPIVGFADSQLLSTLVDGVLFVTSVGITQRHALLIGIEEIQKVRGRIIGTIVNRLESRRNKYGYNFSYYESNEQEGKRKKLARPKEDTDSVHKNGNGKNIEKNGEMDNTQIEAASTRFISRFREKDISHWITRISGKIPYPDNKMARRVMNMIKRLNVNAEGEEKNI